MRVFLQKPLFVQKHDVRAKLMQPFFPEREDENTIQEQELNVCEGALTEKEWIEALKDMGTAAS